MQSEFVDSMDRIAELKKNRFRVEVRASISDFGPGFDNCYIGIDRPVDVYEFEFGDEPGIELEVVDGYDVTVDPTENTAAISARKCLELDRPRLEEELIKEEEISIRIKIHKGIKPNAGLGSSAAGSMAGIRGVLSLFRLDWNKNSHLALYYGEKNTGGIPRVSSVPASYGLAGIILNDPYGCERYAEEVNLSEFFHWNVGKFKDLKIIVCMPDIYLDPKSKPLLQRLNTSRERTPPRDMIPFEDSLLGKYYAAWRSQDIRNVAAFMQYDVRKIHQRSDLIPVFDKARAVALRAGALNFSFCGSGPSVFSLSLNNHEEIGKTIAESFIDSGIRCDHFIAQYPPRSIPFFYNESYPPGVTIID